MLQPFSALVICPLSPTQNTSSSSQAVRSGRTHTHTQTHTHTRTHTEHTPTLAVRGLHVVSVVDCRLSFKAVRATDLFTVN